VQQHGVRVRLSNFIEPDARFPYGDPRDEVRCFQRQESEEVVLPRLKVIVGSHCGNRHLHGAAEILLVETCRLVDGAAEDHWVNGGAAAPKSTVASTMGVGCRWTNKKMWVATWGQWVAERCW
jgi:hypothetical protein